MVISWNTITPVDYIYLLSLLGENNELIPYLGCIMKSLMSIGIAWLVIVQTGCGSGSTEPSGNDVSPSTLSVDITGELEATLIWSICEDEAFSSYVLYRSQASGIEIDQSEAEVLAVFTDADSIEYVDSEIDEVGSIYYALKTTDTNSNTAWSNEESIYISIVPNVDGLTVDPNSHGRDVVLSWNAVLGVDGYKVYFSPTEEEQWVEIIQTPLTSCLDSDAQSAGYYVVKAYQGEDVSPSYSNVASTMPNIIYANYTIYDNYCAGNLPNCFIFGEFEGEVGASWDPDFVQDMYVYNNTGDVGNISFYSGNYGPYGDGNQCFFQQPLASGYCEEYGTWIETDYSPTSSQILFIKLPRPSGGDAFVKVNVLYSVPYWTETGTLICFKYQYQPEAMGLTLFTTND